MSTCNICFEERYEFVPCRRCSGLVCVPCFKRLPKFPINKDCPYCRFPFKKSRNKKVKIPKPEPISPQVSELIRDNVLYRFVDFATTLRHDYERGVITESYYNELMIRIRDYTS
jgi:hypothetical protein